MDFIVVDRAMCGAGDNEALTGFLDANPAVAVVRRTGAAGHEGVIYRVILQVRSKK